MPLSDPGTRSASAPSRSRPRMQPCSPRGREPGAAVPSWKLHWQWVFPKRKPNKKKSNANFIFTSLLLRDTNLSGPVSVLSLGSPCVGGC